MGRRGRVTIEQFFEPDLHYCRCEHSTNVHPPEGRFYGRCLLPDCICRVFVPMEGAKEKALDGTYPRPDYATPNL